MVFLIFLKDLNFWFDGNELGCFGCFCLVVVS